MKPFIILFVTTVVLVRPLWPVAEYVMNYDYIVNTLCENKDRPQMHCDGKCYLIKQLAKESGKDGANPFGESRFNTEIQPVVFFQPFFQINFEIGDQNTILDNFKTSQVLMPTLFTSDIAHPPELT